MSRLVYLLESDVLLARHYRDELESIGCSIQSFRTCSALVRNLSVNIPDFIVMELSLPAHNGLEMLYEVASYSDTRSIKVIINSYVSENSIDWGFVKKTDLGIIEYVEKTSARPGALVEIINEYS